MKAACMYCFCPPRPRPMPPSSPLGTGLLALRCALCRPTPCVFLVCVACGPRRGKLGCPRGASLRGSLFPMEVAGSFSKAPAGADFGADCGVLLKRPLIREDLNVIQSTSPRRLMPHLLHQMVQNRTSLGGHSIQMIIIINQATT